MNEGYFKVRDLRKKEQFIIDDVYLNGYAKFVSPYATCVYLSLCRHADKEQKAFPSIKRIAEQHHISTKSVKRGIKELLFWGIILKQRAGGRLSNTYWLLDKSEWKRGGLMVPTDPSKRAVDSPSRPPMLVPVELRGGSGGATKDAQMKDSQNKERIKILEETKKELIRMKVLPYKLRTEAQEEAAREERRMR
jgi:hypothetical protein